MSIPCPHRRRRLAQTRLRVKASLMLLLPLWPRLPLIASAPAAAQTFPGKPLKLIIGRPAGVPLDAHARLLTDRLGTRLGQSVIVDHKAGAGSVVGFRVCRPQCARRLHPADGQHRHGGDQPGDRQQTVVPDFARRCPSSPQRAAASGPGGEPCGAGAQRGRAPGPGPGRPGPAELRLGQQRRHQPPGARDGQAGRRHLHRAQPPTAAARRLPAT